MTVATQVFAINEKTIVFFDWDFQSRKNADSSGDPGEETGGF